MARSKRLMSQDEISAQVDQYWIDSFKDMMGPRMTAEDRALWFVAVEITIQSLYGGMMLFLDREGEMEFYAYWKEALLY